MRTRTPVIVTTVVASLALTACGGGASKADEADKVVHDWIAAAAKKDGKKFCELMTVDLLETSTGQQSDEAKTTCETQVKSGKGDFPVKFTIQKPTKKEQNAAEVPITAKALNGVVKLKKEEGKFRVDAVQ